MNVFLEMIVFLIVVPLALLGVLILIALFNLYVLLLSDVMNIVQKKSLEWKRRIRKQDGE